MEGFFHLSEIQRTRPSTGLVPKCGACGLFKQCNSPKMKPWGLGRKKILLVGESPGKTEDEKGRPFCGKSGKWLQEVIAGLEKSDIEFKKDLLITNSIICRPPGNKMPKDGKEIDYCRPNLLKTIQEFQPHIIVTLGRHALKSVIEPYWKSDVGPIEKWVGFKIPLEKHWVCPTWHPSFLLREKSKVRDRLFARHLDEAFSLGDVPDSPENKIRESVRVLMNEWEIIQALREIDEAGGWVAVDYETNCLKPEYPKAQIYSFAVSNGETTISFPWFGNNVPKAVSIFLRSKKTRKIASNLKFEDRWTRKHLGHPVRNWGWDTMLAAHVIDNRPGICSLKFQAFVQLGVPSYNENIEPYLENVSGSYYNRIHEIGIETLCLYGGMDVGLEYWLCTQQTNLLYGK